LPDVFNFNKIMQNKNGYMMYVGTYTSGKSEGIYLYKLDPQTGALTHINTTKGIENPSFLAIDPKRKFLFSVSEVGDFEGKKSGAISSFAIDQKTGGLTFLNRQATLGEAPCYVTVDKTGKSVLAANYSGGNVSIFSVGTDGKLSPGTTFQHKGSGPDKKRQEKAHAHCIVLDPANKFAFSADLGIDKIVGYRFDARQSKLISGQPAAVPVKPGAGPRHFAFHPNGRYAFVINELNSTITAFSYTAANGTLKALQTVSTLPQGYSEESYCADIHVSADGKFVYGSNRGHNSIVVFAVDAQSGKLTFVEHVSTGGKWPRNFTLDPTGKLLLVANQNTDNVVAFRIDDKTGKLTATGQVLDVPSPVCLQIVPAFG
jgi:6-phosphogluconolactonase